MKRTDSSAAESAEFARAPAKAAGSRADRDPVGDGMADQVIQCSAQCWIAAERGVFGDSRVDVDQRLLPPGTFHFEARDRVPASPTSTTPASAVATAAVANAVADPNLSQSTPNSSAPGSTSSPAVR